MKILRLKPEDNYVEVEKLLCSKKVKFERRNHNSFIIPAISIAIVIELGFNLIQSLFTIAIRCTTIGSIPFVWNYGSNTLNITKELK